MEAQPHKTRKKDIENSIKFQPENAREMFRIDWFNSVYTVYLLDAPALAYIILLLRKLKIHLNLLWYSVENRCAPVYRVSSSLRQRQSITATPNHGSLGPIQKTRWVDWKQYRTKQKQKAIDIDKQKTLNFNCAPKFDTRTLHSCTTQCVPVST